ncbi:Glutamine-rich protein 2 [Merluccius polli]|uniref:Glutamine-rich protein 2 n=1 Tax=Merluccius polli TaxID=89951 RepID=A0AA47MN08_MERPO|nr:Glutamine-rich protein 2 [Merluccius polli]
MEMIIREARKRRGKLQYQGTPIQIFEYYTPEVAGERAKYRTVMARPGPNQFGALGKILVRGDGQSAGSTGAACRPDAASLGSSEVEATGGSVDAVEAAAAVDGPGFAGGGLKYFNSACEERRGVRDTIRTCIRQNGIRTNGIRQNGIRTNGIRQNGIRTNGIRQNGIRTNGIRQNGIRTNGIRQNGIRTNGIRTNGIRQNGIRTNGIRQNGIRTNGIRQNGIRTNGIRTNGIRQNGIRTNGIRTNGIRQNGIRTHGIRQNGIRTNGIRQNIVREKTGRYWPAEGARVAEAKALAESSAWKNSEDSQQSELRHWSPEQGIRAMLQRVRDVRGVRPCYRFSRRLLWLKVGTSNRRQRFVARYFYDTVVEEGGFVNMLCPVEPDLLYSREMICGRNEQLLVANEEFRLLCGAILGNDRFPQTVDGCLAAYLNLVEELMQWIHRHDVPTPTTFSEANAMYKAMLRERQ